MGVDHPIALVGEDGPEPPVGQHFSVLGAEPYA